MRSAFHACVKAVRRSPNLYAVLGGSLLALAAPLYAGFAQSSHEALQTGSIEPTQPFRTIVRAMGEFKQSWLGGIVLLLTIAVGLRQKDTCDLLQQRLDAVREQLAETNTRLERLRTANGHRAAGLAKS
jgi:hypothetical protein